MTRSARIAAPVAYAFCVALIGSAAAYAASPFPVGQVDHVILGVSDLERGIAQFVERTGVQPIRGGLHPHYGTHNALIATGPAQYIEILAPAPGATLVAFLEPLRLMESLTPIAWVVQTADVTHAAQWLAANDFPMIPPTPGTRAQPDGGTLTWTLLSPNPAASRALPTFIQWGASAVHPASRLPRAARILSIELRDPQPERMERLLSILELPVRVTYADSSAIAVDIESAAGRVRF